MECVFPAKVELYTFVINAMAHNKVSNITTSNIYVYIYLLYNTPVKYNY